MNIIADNTHAISSITIVILKCHLHKSELDIASLCFGLGFPAFMYNLHLTMNIWLALNKCCLLHYVYIAIVRWCAVWLDECRSSWRHRLAVCRLDFCITLLQMINKCISATDSISILIPRLSCHLSVDIGLASTSILSKVFSDKSNSWLLAGHVWGVDPLDMPITPYRASERKCSQ